MCVDCNDCWPVHGYFNLAKNWDLNETFGFSSARELYNTAPTTGVIWGRKISRYSGSSKCLQLGNHWFKACLEHTACREKTKRRLAHRILDVGQCSTLDKVYLIVDSQNCDSYATLSYCWGGIKPLQLTRSSLASFQAGIKVSELPLTFQDTVKVVRTLGIKYLWIDALCIMQDDASD